MIIKVTYQTTPVYISSNVSAVYIKVSNGYSGTGSLLLTTNGTIGPATLIGGTLNIPNYTTDISGLVPYTGATTDVDLGEHELKAGQVEFDQTPIGAAGVGVMIWNDADGTVDLGLKGGNVTIQLGQEQVARVVNKTGNDLLESEFKAVRISGAQGQRLGVQLAQADNDGNSADTIGLVTETILKNQEGFITTFGRVSNINTTGSVYGETWADGDVLYLSGTTPGAITNVKPVAPIHIVVLGYVEYAHQNNGKIFVKVMNGWELGELHDVNTAGATNGQLLGYNGSIWVPVSNGNGTVTSVGMTSSTSGISSTSSPITASGNINLEIATASGSANGLLSSTDWTTFNNKQSALTNPITGTAASGQVAYFTGATTQAGSNNLFWDNANGRLGIGTNAPLTPFEVVSTITDGTGNNLTTTLYSGTFAGASGGFQGRKARGTQASPSQVLSGDSIAGFFASGYHSGGNFGANTAVIRFLAAENFTSTSQGTRIDFATTSTGSNARTIRMQLEPTGNLILQNGGTFTDSGQRLQVQGTSLLNGNTTIGGNTTINLAQSGSLTLNGSGITAGSMSMYFSTAGRSYLEIGNTAFIQNSGNADMNIIAQRTLNISNSQSTYNINITSTGIINLNSRTSVSKLLTVGGTETASSAIARGTLINTTLTAAANNDVLVGLDVNPTFTNGAFTGVTNYAARINGRVFVTRDGGVSATNHPIAEFYRFSSGAGNAGFGVFYSANGTSPTQTFLYAPGGLDFGIRTFKASTSTAETNIICYAATTNVGIGTSTDAGFRLDVNGTARVQGDFTLSDTRNIILGTTTGTKIGTETSQKLSLWNATPDVQPTTAITAAAFVANTSGISDDTATFGGYTIGQIVAALKRIGALA